jgi:hypothetical protein
VVTVTGTRGYAPLQTVINARTALQWLKFLLDNGGARPEVQLQVILALYKGTATIQQHGNAVNITLDANAT